MSSHLAGRVADEFASVQELVAAKVAPFGRGGGALSVYLEGEPVVDLWGGNARPGQLWSETTRTTVASITKSWAAAVVHRLVEQGVLDFETPICTWWPEFTCDGKERITLREVFLHSAGVLGYPGQEQLLSGDGWDDYDAIAAGLASAKPWWEPGTKHGYHAVSFGWLVQEVVRRTTGRTVGDIFRTDFAEPLGLDATLGTPAAEQSNVAEVLLADVAAMPRLQRWAFVRAEAASIDPATPQGCALVADGRTNILQKVDDLVRHAPFLEAEVPASNGASSARSLARLFAAFGNDGQLGDVRVLTPESVHRMRQIQTRGRDSVMGALLPWPMRLLARPAALTLGFLANQKPAGKWLLGPNPAAFGSAGFGGQLVLADPDVKLALAWVCTDFTPGIDKLAIEALEQVYRVLAG